MDDERIIELYFSRSEDAIAETAKKYGRYCHTVAFRILRSASEAEECVDDTYMRAWGAIPPDRPRKLSAYLARITRNLALDRYGKARAAKRYSTVTVALDELTEVISDPADGELCEGLALAEALNHFLGGLPENERRVFLQRYWYLLSVREIAEENRLTETNVKVMLFRVREKLKGYLTFRGITV